MRPTRVWRWPQHRAPPRQALRREAVGEEDLPIRSGKIALALVSGFPGRAADEIVTAPGVEIVLGVGRGGVPRPLVFHGLGHVGKICGAKLRHKNRNKKTRGKIW